MKVLAMYTTCFEWTPKVKNSDHALDNEQSGKMEECILVFIQTEECDEEKDVKSREKKLVNHIKWVSRKNETKRVVLHSFAHLSESKASFDFTKNVFNAAEVRLKNAGFETCQTPFGYFLDLNIQAPGYSLARIWATL